MNKELLKYIRHLSKQDRKTLSQKVLKVGEEFGELARVALPFDGAYATNHRFTERESILEEAVDTMLTALSVAHDLDFTDEEIEAMLVRKTEKWAGLQAKEADLKYPLPFEIHITVKLNNLTTEADRFRKTCAELGVKPIILDLQDKKGKLAMKDVMTSSKHFGNNRSAYIAASQLANELLTEYGFQVVRVKLETVPWHPAAPQNESEVMPPSCYFESHIPVTLRAIDESYLRQIVQELNYHVHASRNVFKVLDDGQIVVMLTYRRYEGTASSFATDVAEITNSVSACLGLSVGKVHTEFAVYDTKVSHDSTWLESSK
jgi:hypothetical protein